MERNEISSQLTVIVFLVIEITEDLLIKYVKDIYIYIYIYIENLSEELPAATYAYIQSFSRCQISVYMNIYFKGAFLYDEMTITQR